MVFHDIFAGPSPNFEIGIAELDTHLWYQFDQFS